MTVTTGALIALYGFILRTKDDVAVCFQRANKPGSKRRIQTTSENIAIIARNYKNLLDICGSVEAVDELITAAVRFQTGLREEWLSGIMTRINDLQQQLGLEPVDYYGMSRRTHEKNIQRWNTGT